MGTLPLTGVPVAQERCAKQRGAVRRLERRLQALEDAAAIRNLKARYAALCDAQYDADGIAA